MSVEEIRRSGIIQKSIGGEVTQVKGAQLIGISDRQMRRIIKRVRESGIAAIAHGNRGRVSNRRISNKTRKQILKLYDKLYYDFGPTLASEKLLERDGIEISHDTLRLWLLDQGKHEWQRKKRPHKKWRARKECIGEMIQLDGSEHDWLEGRGPEMVLMGYVDDATGRVHARFYKYEGVLPAMDSMYRYIEQYGLPQSVYLDRHSTYKTTRHKTIFEQLMNSKVLTQFERAMAQLRIKVIHAYSPQAKGRIENLFGTFQDRLIKEMRLVGIKTLQAANKFLEKYLQKYNERFNVPAKLSTNLHRRRPSRYILDKILCSKEERTLSKDSTVRYKKKVYLIINRVSTRISRVTVVEKRDGVITIKYRTKSLSYKEIEPCVRIDRQKEVIRPLTKSSKQRKSSTPAENHPWRQFSPGHYIEPCDYEALDNEQITACV